MDSHSPLPMQMREPTHASCAAAAFGRIDPTDI
jgi:hypothetical protein